VTARNAVGVSAAARVRLKIRSWCAIALRWSAIS